MGLDLWLKDDIGNVLQGIALATPHMGAERSEAEAAAFREGFIAALTAAAVALGIAGTPARGRMVGNSATAGRGSWPLLEFDGRHDRG